MSDGSAGPQHVAPRPPGRSVARRAGAVIGVAAVLVGVSIWLGPRLQSPEQAAAEAKPPEASLITVAAERRRLEEPLVLRGRVIPGPRTKLVPPASLVGPHSVVTKVLIRKGDYLREGRLVLESSGQPLVALALPFPLYRDLTSESAGPDVLEVQKALRRLGYVVPTTGRMDTATLNGLQIWWRSLGYELPRAGGKPTQEAPGDATGDSPSTATGGEAGGAPGHYLPRAAILRIPTKANKVSAVKVKVGTVIDDQQMALLELDAGASFIKASATKEQVGLLSLGQDATVLDEISGKKVKATVSKIGKEPETDDDLSLTGFPVTLSFTDQSFSAPGRTVRIDAASAASAAPHLAVPVTAVYSRPDGSTYVTVVDADGRTIDVTVETGQIGGGWVAITPDSPDAVDVGSQVVVGSS